MRFVLLRKTFATAAAFVRFAEPSGNICAYHAAVSNEYNARSAMHAILKIKR